MAAKAYSNFPLNLGGSASSGGAPMDFLSDTLQFSLHNSYTPAQTTHILYATNWTSASFTCDTGILWDNTPSTPLDPLICYDNFGTQTVTAATFTYVVAATGFFTIAVS
jgi:hypothetical protein